MATFALDDATIWVGGYDFTTDLNQVSLNITADELDSTTFGGGGYRSRRGGLRSVAAQLAGFWQSPPDDATFGSLGTADEVATIAPDSAETTPAYLFQAGKFAYEAFGAVGDLTPFSVGLMGTNKVGVVRGQVAKAKANVGATGATGSPVNLGAGAAGQYLYLGLHVFSAGTTLSVKVESDNAQAFSSPSDVASATITSVTTTGGRWMTRVDASSITDTWYRLNVTAVTGTFSIAAAIGIGS